MTKDESSPIYVNSEQREKPQWGDELEQEAIDNAFKQRPRTSSNRAHFGGRVIYLLNGKFTGGLGVETRSFQGKSLRVTDLERTLIDAAVRPHYAGGVGAVLRAYEKTSGKVSICRIADMLGELDFIYPYHQAIGYYLEATGHFGDKELRQGDCTVTQVPINTFSR